MATGVHNAMYSGAARDGPSRARPPTLAVVNYLHVLVHY